MLRKRPFRQRNVFFAIRKKILLGFYATIAASIGLTLLYMISSLIKTPSWLPVVLGIVYTILCTLSWAIIGDLLDIPNIATDFDEIKNDIASRAIREPEEFAKRVVELLCSFIRFPYFEVRHAFMKIDKHDYIYSSGKVVTSLDASIFEGLLEKSKETEEVSYEDAHVIEGSPHHLYLVPIWFGDDWLGYFAVLTKQKLWNVFKNFLSVFEDDYLDDQLVHVLQIKKQIVQKMFYREMDQLSNKITKRQYTSISAYQADVLKLLIDKTSAAGGIFFSVYSEEPTIQLGQDLSSSGVRDYFSPPLEIPPNVAIYSDPNVETSHILRLPILIDALQGAIYLFSHSDDLFRYFRNTLMEIEDIKIDNDLENLALQLNLSPCERPPIFLEGNANSHRSLL